MLRTDLRKITYKVLLYNNLATKNRKKAPDFILIMYIVFSEMTGLGFYIRISYSVWIFKNQFRKR